MNEKDKILRWLRRGAWADDEMRSYADFFADRIEAGDYLTGEHLVRSEPTIPASVWMKESNVGH